MHSKDPGKQTGPLFDQFWREFDAILDTAGEREAHFEHFSFPSLNLIGRTFRAICRFEHATFMQKANFNVATFTHRAHFTGATFTRHANFYGATFTQNADFVAVSFRGEANFSYANFTQGGNFGQANFTQGANFILATFTEYANFFGATFTRDANFSRATFTQGANFLHATFTQNANFIRATFTQHAHFHGATFTKEALFVDTAFHGTASWQSSLFLESAEFRRTKFDPQFQGTPSTRFALATFTKPGQIVFDEVDLSRVLFHNCDVSQVWFTSSARWGQRGKRRAMVFEETIPLDQDNAKALHKNGTRDYRAVAQIYQQLKKNYDARLDYWTANEFHFGEMEMQRLAAPTRGMLPGLRRWWHPRLSFVALYRWGSDYGNSYVKPIWWLLLVGLLFFALLFPLPGVGLRHSGTNYTETYVSVWRAGRQAGHSPGQSLRWEARLLGKSILTAIDTATFQKSPDYAPAYPWGHLLAVIETLLTSTLFALFLLAIRRQFRR